MATHDLAHYMRPGSLQLAAPSDTVAQTAGTMNFTVHRTGGSAGAVGSTSVALQ